MKMSPIRKYRKQHNLTLKEASELLGISFSYLSELETGKAKMTLSAAKKIEKRTGALKAVDLLGLAERT